MQARYNTRAMFEQFGHILYECGAYQVEEIEKHRTYIAIHSEAEKREKWCRVSYKVTMLDGGNEFKCECGRFAHMGLLCIYVLKVLDFIRAKEIPAKHIVKRWTRDARDVLPAHLAQYQKDSMQNNPFSYRHFTMYMHAMELVRLRDTSVEAYNRLMDLFKSNLTIMLPLAEIRDGLGLEDRLADKGAVVNERNPTAIVAEQNENLVRDVAKLADNDSMSRTSNQLDGLMAPARRKEMGRPTTSREKAPYEEGLSKRTMFCTICRRQGHKQTTCPDRGDMSKQPRKPARCKNCGVEGHRQNNCKKAMELRLAGGM
ncbi:hypothetical protein VPH35_010148 [Triticum aestivum]|uniref:uncharacterized protein n=1 Tax=Triticum aestivum TaxID=4565 RepID=UPI001D031B01|nr:uncharacterized protein LOC123095699 [Triticum aestivum]